MSDNIIQNTKLPFIILSGITVYIIKETYSFIYKHYERKKLTEKAKNTLIKRDKKISAFLEKYNNYISEEKIDYITSLTLNELCSSIKSQLITSKHATIAYCIKSATVGKKLKLITDVRFDDAIEESEKADLLINSTDDKNLLPPLIGIPVSIKDVVRVKDTLTTLGIQKLCYTKETKNYNEESHIIEILRQNGAIPFCLTNVPQGLFACESANQIYGSSMNPWDTKRTSGGSSGGCGGLVASFSSPFSFCGDLAGSTRQPAHFNGLYGLKPSASRITSVGQLKLSGDEYTGYQAFLSAPGFLARSFDDCLLLSKTFYGKFNKDFTIPQVPFNQSQYENGLVSSFNKNKKVKIGIVKSLDFCEPFEDMKHTIDNISTNLLKENFELFDFNMNQFYNTFLISIQNVMHVVGGINNVLSYEKPYYYHSFMLKYFHMNSLVRRLSIYYFNLIGENRHAERIKWFETNLLSSYNYLSSIKLLDKLIKQFYSYCNENEIECIIMPTLPFPSTFRD